VSFIHEQREANEAAHNLAKATTTTLETGRHVWFLNPPFGMGIPVNASFDQ
jgi:hypothetical protein